MPELPEVQTTVNGLKPKVLNRTFVDVWSDWERVVKKPSGFKQFEKEIRGKKIKEIRRRAKNIIFDLSQGCSLLVHQKMTGHLLYGKWERNKKIWKPAGEQSALSDPHNRFLHLIFFFDNGFMMALSDTRKFAKAELWKTDALQKELEKLGPEPLADNFTFEKFLQVFNGKKGKIKQVLMNPEIIAGIGNIYSNEALWEAKIHPEKNIAKLNNLELKLLYLAIKKVLAIGIKLGGESFSDYRKPDGSKGGFDAERKAYKREGQKCLRCRKAVMKRITIAARSAFFCPNCQKFI